MPKPKEPEKVDPSKQLAPYRAKVNAVQKAASEYYIANQADLEKGADLLHEVKDIKTKLTERKEEITRPLMDALGSVRNLFKPLETTYLEAERTIKDKMLEWQTAEDERIEKQKASDLARVNRGTMKVETAVSRIGSRGEAPKTAEGVTGKIQTREVQKLEIFDESVLPREYLIPDRAKIFDALKKGTEISGARIKMEKVIAAK